MLLNVLNVITVQYIHFCIILCVYSVGSHAVIHVETLVNGHRVTGSAQQESACLFRAESEVTLKSALVD